MEQIADIQISYGWLSLVPSLLAIGVALVTRQVYISLFLGVCAGSWVIAGGGLETLPQSLFSALDTYVLQAIVPENGDTSRLSILLFALMTGGMIGITSANGGMSGVARHLVRLAGTRRKAQGAAALLGGLVFFDNLASAVITGNTMRPLIDHLKISREKLAFIVNAVAVAVASLAMVSTWFAFEASLIESSLPENYRYVSGFDLMMAAVGYSFYPLLLVLFVVLLVATGRDFGVMLRVEKRTLSQHRPDYFIAEEGEMHTNAISGVVPILTLIGVTLAGLLLTGEGETIREIISSADPFRALLWGGMAGLGAAVVLSLATRALTLAETREAMEHGFHPMLTAGIILTLAWALADINGILRAADFLLSGMGEGMALEWLPVAVFFFTALVSFATGTGWGAMGIIVPAVLPLAITLLAQQGSMEDPASHPMLLITIASILSGAVFGEHCSPVSNTAILSSQASGCNHLNHIVSQLPYALVVAVVSAVVCILPVSYGLPWWWALLAGVMVLAALLQFAGKPAIPEGTEE